MTSTKFGGLHENLKPAIPLRGKPTADAIAYWQGKIYIYEKGEDWDSWHYRLGADRGIWLNLTFEGANKVLYLCDPRTALSASDLKTADSASKQNAIRVQAFLDLVLAHVPMTSEMKDERWAIHISDIKEFTKLAPWYFNFLYKAYSMGFYLESLKRIGGGWREFKFCRYQRINRKNPSINSIESCHFSITIKYKPRKAVKADRCDPEDRWDEDYPLGINPYPIILRHGLRVTEEGKELRLACFVDNKPIWLSKPYKSLRGILNLARQKIEILDQALGPFALPYRKPITPNWGRQFLPIENHPSGYCETPEIAEAVIQQKGLEVLSRRYPRILDINLGGEVEGDHRWVSIPGTPVSFVLQQMDRIKPIIDQAVSYDGYWELVIREGVVHYYLSPETFDILQRLFNEDWDTLQSLPLNRTEVLREALTAQKHYEPRRLPERIPQAI